MAPGFRSILSLLLWPCIITISYTQSDGRITDRKLSIQFTQRSLACSGEAVTISCTSNGSGISWDSDPPLGENGRSRIIGFVKNDGAGTYLSYLLIYRDSTAFFVSAVLQNIEGNDCNSSLTLIPISNADGNYPTSYGNFKITCNTTNTTVTNPGMEWIYRVAAVPGPIPIGNAMCIYHPLVKVMEVKITGYQNTTTDLSYYEVSMNGKKANVSVHTPSTDGMYTKTFYPVPDKPKTVLITAVDVCNQRSEPTMVPCSGSGVATLMPIMKIVTLIITLMLLK